MTTSSTLVYGTENYSSRRMILLGKFNRNRVIIRSFYVQHSGRIFICSFFILTSILIIYRKQREGYEIPDFPQIAIMPVNIEKYNL